jgi:hypothetical protein
MEAVDMKESVRSRWLVGLSTWGDTMAETTSRIGDSKP